MTNDIKVAHAQLKPCPAAVDGSRELVLIWFEMHCRSSGSHSHRAHDCDVSHSDEVRRVQQLTAVQSLLKRTGPISSQARVHAHSVQITATATKCHCGADFLFQSAPSPWLDPADCCATRPFTRRWSASSCSSGVAAAQACLISIRKMAKELRVPDGEIKHAFEELGLSRRGQPGHCSPVAYFT